MGWGGMGWGMWDGVGCVMVCGMGWGVGVGWGGMRCVMVVLAAACGVHVDGTRRSKRQENENLACLGDCGEEAAQ